MTSKLLIPCVPVLLAAAIHAAEIEKRVHRLPPPGPERDCFYTLRWPSAGDLGPRASFGPIAFDSKSPDDEEAGAIPSPEERFAAFIREQVAPEILEQEGGSVEVEGKSIVVAAPPAVHERIAHLLEMLAPDELLVHVDMALVPTGALPEGSVVGSELAWETIARALEKGGEGSARVTLACRNGEAGQTF